MGFTFHFLLRKEGNIMKLIRGTLRLTCFILLLMLTTLLVLLTAWIPVRIKGARLSAWFLPTVCHLLLPLFNVEFTVREADRITRHDGAATDEELGEDPAGDNDQVQDAGAA